ncbi:transcription factor SRM1 [Salvia divinorum]|uniref:Transcription factor SRM1 n=1 Tax=Salvia divinorum TaxID=28513 RepID=A0ABD1HJV5_SALDI
MFFFFPKSIFSLSALAYAASLKSQPLFLSLLYLKICLTKFVINTSRLPHSKSFLQPPHHNPQPPAAITTTSSPRRLCFRHRRLPAVPSSVATLLSFPTGCFLWGWRNAVEVTGKPFPVILWRRSSIHDMTNVNNGNGDVSVPQVPITGVGMYGPPTMGQPIIGPLVSTVCTPVNLPPPPHLAYGVGAPVHVHCGIGAPVHGPVVPGAPMNMVSVPYLVQQMSGHR